MAFIESDFGKNNTYRFGFFSNTLKNLEKNHHEESKQDSSSTGQTEFARFYQRVKNPTKQLEELMLLALRTGSEILKIELLDLILQLITKDNHLINHTLKLPGFECNPVELAIRQNCFSVASKLLKIGKDNGFKELHLIRDADLRFKYRSQSLSLEKDGPRTPSP